MPLISTLAIALLAGLPEVTIADEHRPGGDPAEVKVAVTNRTEEIIGISFREQQHIFWFKFHLFDERGRPAALERTKLPNEISGPSGLVWIKPGKTVTGYLSPKLDYVVPPGRFQVSLTYYHLLPYETFNDRMRENGSRAVESNRITKTFP